MGDLSIRKAGSSLRWNEPEAVQKPPKKEYLISEPSLAGSLVPVIGSSRQAAADFERGRWGWGIFNTVMAVTDLIPVKAIWTAGSKVGLKGLIRLGYFKGKSWKSFRFYKTWKWSEVRQWANRVGWSEYKGQPFHHWLVPRRWYENKPWEKTGEFLFNQPWNILRIPSQRPRGLKPKEFHDLIEGKLPSGVEIRYSSFQRVWYGTPQWSKAASSSASGRIINGVRNGQSKERN